MNVKKIYCCLGSEISKPKKNNFATEDLKKIKFDKFKE